MGDSIAWLREELTIRIHTAMPGLDWDDAGALALVVTQDWKVKRKKDPDSAQRYYSITTPLTAPSPQEREADEEREARWEWLYRRESDDVPPPPHLSTLDLMDQSVWWITRDQRVMRLDDMTPQHRSNLLALLRKRATSLQFGEWTSGLFADAPDEVADQAAEEDPIAWLHRQKFVKRLRKLVHRDNRAKAREGAR